jgi:hypothetical protein
MVDADMEAAGLRPVGQGARVLAEKFPEWRHRALAVTSTGRNGQKRFD